MFSCLWVPHSKSLLISVHEAYSLSDEKKKTKSIDNELNPEWNEVDLSHWQWGFDEFSPFRLLQISDICWTISPPRLVLQAVEFDLKGARLDSTSHIDVIVKDYETIGKNK